MPRPVVPPSDSDTFANDTAVLQRILRRVQLCGREGKWKQETAGHLAEVVRLFNDDTNRVLSAGPTSKRVASQR